MSIRESPGDGNSSVDTTMTPMGKRIAVVPFPNIDDSASSSPPKSTAAKAKPPRVADTKVDAPQNRAAAAEKSPSAHRLDLRMRQKVSELEAEVDRLSARLREEELATQQANLAVKKLRKEKTNSSDHSHSSGSLNVSSEHDHQQRLEELNNANKKLQQTADRLKGANELLEIEVARLQGLLKASSLTSLATTEGSQQHSKGLEEQVKQLKEMLEDRDSTIASQRARIAALAVKPEEPTPENEAVETNEEVSMLKEKLKSVMEDNRLLNEELDRNAVELGKLEHRLARGEYNVRLTKVMRPTLLAPCTHCVGLRAELATVKAERDEAADLLSKAGGGGRKEAEDGEDPEEDGASLEAGLKIAELHKQLAEKDKYILRLSEMAKSQIQEYKEVAKALFGFSLSKHKAPNNTVALGQYQVRSLFAADRDDVLLVHAQDGGRQVDMLSTAYSVRMKEHADLFFQQAHLFPPLPALLASITIEHYARITSAPDP